MLFELRQYRAKPGQRDALVRVMEEDVIPFNVAQGVVVVGSFIHESDPDGYVWIRRFADEAERERLYRAVYESDHWRDVIRPRIDPYLDRPAIVVTRLLPTRRSVIA